MKTANSFLTAIVKKGLVTNTAPLRKEGQALMHGLLNGSYVSSKLNAGALRLSEEVQEYQQGVIVLEGSKGIHSYFGEYSASQVRFADGSEISRNLFEGCGKISCYTLADYACLLSNVKQGHRISYKGEELHGLILGNFTEKGVKYVTFCHEVGGVLLALNREMELNAYNSKEELLILLGTSEASQVKLLVQGLTQFDQALEEGIEVERETAKEKRNRLARERRAIARNA